MPFTPEKEKIRRKHSLSTEDTGGPGTLPEAHPCPEGEVWDEESQSCIPVEAPLPHIQDKPPELEGESIHESLDLKSRIENVVRDYFTEMERRLSKMIDTKISLIVKQKETDVEQALRKSFGLDKDPVIHLSDLEKYMRKATLQSAPSGKRSPASPSRSVGPAGNVALVKSQTTKGQLDDLFKPYKEEAKVA